MYVVAVGGSQDNRGFDPYDSTVRTGAYLVYYQRESSETEAEESVGFE